MSHQNESVKNTYQEGYLFKPAMSEELFQFGPTIECRCKKGDSCSTNRIRGKCARDPDYGPTTVAPEKCWFIKPSLPDGFELAGPCVFPLNHNQVSSDWLVRAGF